MKAIITFLLLSLGLWNQEKVAHPETERILEAWIATQNDGTDAAIKDFIDTYYSPEMLNKMKNYEDHMAFYRQVIDEFGEVQDIIYETETDSKTSLKVQLLKKTTPLVPEPAPEEILVIEIDLNPEQPAYLKRALGMGALICYIKR